MGLKLGAHPQLGSVVLAYVIVFGVTVVLPIAWGSTAVVLNEEREVTNYYTVYDDEYSMEKSRCAAEQVEETVPRLDLSPPLSWEPGGAAGRGRADPPRGLRPPSRTRTRIFWTTLKTDALRRDHHPPRPPAYCSPDDPGYPTDLGTPPNRPVWPMGLGLWLLVGALRCWSRCGGSPCRSDGSAQAPGSPEATRPVVVRCWRAAFRYGDISVPGRRVPSVDHASRDSTGPLSSARAAR